MSNGRGRRGYSSTRGSFSKITRTWFLNRTSLSCTRLTPIKNLWKLIFPTIRPLWRYQGKYELFVFFNLISINSWFALVECSWEKSCSKIMSLLFLKSFLLLMSSPFVLVRYSKKQKYQLNIPTFSTSISHRCRKEPLSKYVWVPERQNYMTESLFQPSLFLIKLLWILL